MLCSRHPHAAHKHIAYMSASQSKCCPAQAASHSISLSNHQNVAARCWPFLLSFLHLVLSDCDSIQPAP